MVSCSDGDEDDHGTKWTRSGRRAEPGAASSVQDQPHHSLRRYASSYLGSSTIPISKLKILRSAAPYFLELTASPSAGERASGRVGVRETRQTDRAAQLEYEFDGDWRGQETHRLCCSYCSSTTPTAAGWHRPGLRTAGTSSCAAAPAGERENRQTGKRMRSSASQRERRRGRASDGDAGRVSIHTCRPVMSPPHACIEDCTAGLDSLSLVAHTLPPPNHPSSECCTSDTLGHTSLNGAAPDDAAKLPRSWSTYFWLMVPSELHWATTGASRNRSSILSSARISRTRW